MFINQTKYRMELLNKYEQGVKMDITKYRGIIGSLLHLTTSRPDIMLSICMCAQFQASPRESHFKIVERILRYHNGTSHRSLWFPKGNECNLVGFSDSYFAGCKSDMKGDSKTCNLFENYLVSWHSKKHHAVSLSTTKAKYVVASNFYVQVLWINKQLLDYDLKIGYDIIKCNNTSMISLIKNHVLNSCTKHIEI